ncbi:hypothetical protein BKG96_10440 [Rodentibacter caecimuris]|uniref:Type III toxin-antitoxin system ToxN/AbiQ family toxin n=1 Tax=Rodentibacter caecimuris TaxID=1796644 RepID=A0A1V3KF23_9PAST|nr:type III toxin-antitoxin system ToxN/AbiQ family toxin [Rodentibacter heylii]OOF75846.1 hypothetical protein BKG96_10440 [Rodentibacter heylii]
MASNTLELYYIDDEYIRFLKQAGNNGVENNYAKADNQKPYLGVVLVVNTYKYFAPLSSPKAKYERMADSNPTVFKIIKGKDKKLLGVVRLNNMIPAPDTVLSRIEVNSISNQGYKNLLLSQRRIILSNAGRIQRKAEIMYDLVVNKKNEFYCKLSNNFSELEKSSDNYTKLESSE